MFNQFKICFHRLQEKQASNYGRTLIEKILSTNGCLHERKARSNGAGELAAEKIHR